MDAAFLNTTPNTQNNWASPPHMAQVSVSVLKEGGSRGPLPPAWGLWWVVGGHTPRHGGQKLAPLLLHQAGGTDDFVTRGAEVRPVDFLSEVLRYHLQIRLNQDDRGKGKMEWGMNRGIRWRGRDCSPIIALLCSFNGWVTYKLFWEPTKLGCP